MMVIATVFGGFNGTIVGLAMLLIFGTTCSAAISGYFFAAFATVAFFALTAAFRTSVARLKPLEVH